MACGIRTTYLRGVHKGFGCKFQRLSAEEYRSVQRPRCREYDNKAEDNSPKDINNLVMSKANNYV